VSSHATPSSPSPRLAFSAGFLGKSAGGDAIPLVAPSHDELFRFVTRGVRHACAWLRSVVPAGIDDSIAWASLRPASEVLQDVTLREQRPDRVYYVEHAITSAPAWVLGEHKAFADPGVVDQVLRYAVVLRNLSPDEGHAPPIPVLAVLLHHGDEPFVLRGAGDWLGEFQPNLRLLVDDLAAQDEATILARELTPLVTMAFLCMRVLRGADGAFVLAAFERWADLLRAVDRDTGPPDGEAAIAAIAGYVLRTTQVGAADLHIAFERMLHRPEKTIMSTAEKLVNQGIARGIEQGMEQGIARGRIATLVRLLERRFGTLPPQVVVRLHEATPAELDRITDRVLEAPSLAAIFAD